MLRRAESFSLSSSLSEAGHVDLCAVQLPALSSQSQICVSGRPFVWPFRRRPESSDVS